MGLSIYEMMRAIGHPIDLLGNSLNTNKKKIKKARKKLDIL
jgi:hypothetical protein